ncbi:MAG: hypothetical protein LIP09_06995 [Bacteroidales bacterium]|nr:hypothetical protein [Bacteroidales bacterium]
MKPKEYDVTATEALGFLKEIEKKYPSNDHSDLAWDRHLNPVPWEQIKDILEKGKNTDPKEACIILSQALMGIDKKCGRDDTFRDEFGLRTCIYDAAGIWWDILRLSDPQMEPYRLKYYMNLGDLLVPGFGEYMDKHDIGAFGAESYLPAIDWAIRHNEPWAGILAYALAIGGYYFWIEFETFDFLEELNEANQ